MPLDTKRVSFDDAKEELTEQMEELAEKQANWDGSDDAVEQLLQQGITLENQRKVLDVVAEDWGIDAVTFGGLTAGEVNLVQDIVERHDEVRERDAWVAVGTRKAPYLEHTPSELSREAVEETVANVVDLPLPYVTWAEAQISDLSYLGGDAGNGYADLVLEKQRSTEDGTNG